MKNNKVVAVVVTFNRVDLLAECLRGLEKQDKLDGVIIVNNASTDSTGELLRRKQSESDINIHVINLSTNTGGAGGFHRGLLEAVELGYDLAWIMDDDAIPTERALNSLLDCATRVDNKFGFIASKVVDESGLLMNTPQIDFTKNEIGYPNWASDLDKGYVKLSTATFVSIMISTKVITKVGLPVKEMFIWGDDTEYTQRISKCYPSYYDHGSVVTHKRIINGVLSLITEKDDKRLLWHKNAIRNNGYRLRKHEGRKQYIRYLLNNILFLFVILYKSDNKRFKRCSCVLAGLFNSLFFDPKIIFPKVDTSKSKHSQCD